MKTPLHQVAVVLSKRSMKAGINNAKFAREVAAYLLDSGRTGELESLLREISKERAKAGNIEVTAYSSHTLPANVLAEIRFEAKKLYPHAKHINIYECLDPDLIGGIRLEYPDYLLDLSIRSQLNRFRTLTTAERTA